MDIVGSMIKAVDVPDEFEEKPRILALLCENDAFPALDLVGQHRLQYQPLCPGDPGAVPGIGQYRVGHGGRVGRIRRGHLIGCKYGDDYQCHFIKGSELAVTRGDNIREKLEQMAMENERVELHQLQISEYEDFRRFSTTSLEVIDEYGMNPFKGM